MIKDNSMKFSSIFFFFFFVFVLIVNVRAVRVDEVTNELVILLISQPHIYFLSQIHNASTFIPTHIPLLYTHSYSSSVDNSYTLHPIFPSILHQYPSMKWLLIGEGSTRFHFDVLHNFLHAQENRSLYLGHGLYDSEPSIIHHYSLDLHNPYPDFAPGLILSRDVLVRLTDRLKSHSKSIDFIIDVKYELNQLINELSGMKLESRADLFCYDDRAGCLTWNEYSLHDYQCDRKDLQLKDLYFGIKTFHEHHSSRIPLLKKTWLTPKLNYHLFTDTIDRSNERFIATHENTVRGHCHKTFFIFNHFHHAQSNEQYLIVADDDTLLSVSRLLRLIRCLLLSNDLPLVLGERYGYGNYYEYPTGGSAMIFNRQAVQQIVSNCQCPSSDTPDDMFIGLCLKRLQIPLIHIAQLHQAQPNAYADQWLKHQKSISFHKFEGINVEEIYRIYLDETKPKRPIDEF